MDFSELSHQTEIRDSLDKILSKHCSQEGLKEYDLNFKHNANLLSQYDGFMGYVMEAEKNGIDNYPLYQWTKDSLAKEGKIEKYNNSYTVYINSEEVYPRILADNIERDLAKLVDKETLLRISKHDTNPKNNPQPPSKYK